MRKYYDILDSVGGGDPNKLPEPPKNYQPVSLQQRGQWNDFLDYAGKQNIDFDKNPQAAANLMAQYKKTNPNFSITPDQIQNIQYEQYQLRKGDKFGSLGPEQLKYLRQGLPDSYLNRPIPDANGQFNNSTSKLYYPQKGSFGTDIESYVHGVSGTPNPVRPADAIPLPDYTNPKSRLQYAQNWLKKYGPLMKDRGDTPLRVNEIPQFGSSTSKDMSVSAAKSAGIDPALLYSSAMEEGMSGNFKDSKGQYRYERSGQSDKFPVNSSSDFGLDQVRSEIKRFQSKGYLPSDFQKHYINAAPILDEGGKPVIDPKSGKPYTTNDVDLDSPESAMKLKAAYLRDNYDDIDTFAKQNGIKLSQTARDFFALANYNGGTGLGHKMLMDYNKNGYLNNDKFLDERPTKGEGLKASSYGPIYDKNGKQTDEGMYTHIIRRIKMQQALKKEGLF